MSKVTNIVVNKNVAENFSKVLSKHFGVYGSFSLASNVATLLTISIFTRKLGAESYGVYAYLQAIVLFFSTSITQWVVQSTLRYRSIYKQSHLSEIFTSLYSCIIIFLSIITLVCGLFLSTLPAQILGRNLSDYFLFVILFAVTNIWITLLLTIYQSDLEPLYYSFFTFIRNFLRLTIPGFLLLTLEEVSLSIFFQSIIFAEVVCVIALVYRLHGKHFSLQCNFQLSQLAKPLKTFWNYGSSMVGYFVCSQLLSISDRFFLQYYFGSEYVGKYSANYSLVTMGLSVVAIPLLNAAHPLLMTFANNTNVNNSKAEDAVQNATRMFLLISVPTALLLFLFRTNISALILGHPFSEVSFIFGPVILGVLVWNLSMYGNKVLEIQLQTKKMLFFAVVSALVNVAAEIILIPKYSFWGAALATTIGYSVYAVLVYVGARRGVRWKLPWKTMVRLALICSALILFVNGFEILQPSLPLFSIILYSLLLLFIYLIALILGGEFKIKHINDFIAQRIFK